MPYSVKEAQEGKATVFTGLSDMSFEKAVCRVVEIFVHGFMPKENKIQNKEEIKRT